MIQTNRRRNATGSITRWVRPSGQARLSLYEIVGPRQALQRERRPRAVAAYPLERVAIVLGDHDTRVQRETLAPKRR
jgi:hypothetical protein